MTRAFLFAKATAAIFLLRLPIKFISQLTGFSLCLTNQITALAPRIINVRRYVSPRLLIPSNTCLPPLEFCLGINPSHAANCRPFLNSLTSPTVTTMTLAVIGPNLGITVNLRTASFSLQSCRIKTSSSSTCRSISFRLSTSALTFLE